MANLAQTKKKVAEADAKQGTGGLMTSKVDKAAKAMMANRVNPNQVWAVVGVVDRSGSMAPEYRDGTVQEIVNRMLAFSLIVDDDGTVPTIFFDNQVMQVDIQLDDFHDYLSRNRIGAGGTTDLTAALEAAARETGNEDVIPTGGGRGGFLRRGSNRDPEPRKATTPAYVIIVTDGAPNDPASATEMLRRLSFRGVFVKILFVGDDARGWNYVDGLDNALKGCYIDNVNTQNMGDVKRMSDDEFFNAMFAEVNDWLPNARAKGLIS